MNDIQMREHLISKGYKVDGKDDLVELALLEGYNWNIENLRWENKA